MRPWGRYSTTARRVTSSAAESTRVNNAFLIEQDVRQWTEIPLWRAPLGTWQADRAAATAADPVGRSIAETVLDTRLWLTEKGLRTCCRKPFTQPF